MRVHGEVVIKRRSDVEDESSYQKYGSKLREDFGRICGYCGKTEMTTNKGFEIDHFVPIRIASERETDYSNLVYSCFTCNRKKSKKWPTEDKDKQHDGNVGFIDPATDEFDEHLKRTDNGDIIGITDVGKYMCKTAFKFNTRPMKEIWTCTKILERQSGLEGRMQAMTHEESTEYILINQQIKELYRILFNKKE
jgi:uncharacterized protein (TIGR02646 family)